MKDLLSNGKKSGNGVPDIMSLMGKIKMPTPEEIEERLRQRYKEDGTTPENMSLWLPHLTESKTQGDSVLKIPKTKTVTLDYDWYKWLRNDSYTPEKVKEFNEYLLSLVGDFEEGKPFFMKTGIYSDKFVFEKCAVRDRSTVGQHFLDIFYNSMIVGAASTNEVVFRELIEDEDASPTIYHGMPLHTEFRVFYDYDTKRVVGVANYWHPDIMENALRNPYDQNGYRDAKEKLLSEYETFKAKVCEEVATFMEGVGGMDGRWSVDVMKNGDSFWLIDMARMERSALLDQMEPIGEEDMSTACWDEV